MPERSRFMEWTRAWKPPARDHRGLWVGMAGVVGGIGVGLWFVVPILGAVCVAASFYIVLAIMFGWKLPPTHADWEDYKLERYKEFLLRRDGLWEVHGELGSALGYLNRDLANGTYSGVVVRQDKWVQHGTSIKNDPAFAAIKDLIEIAYQAIEVHSVRSYDAGTGAAEPEIPSRETEDLRRAIADVDAARSAAARKLAELGVDQP